MLNAQRLSILILAIIATLAPAMAQFDYIAKTGNAEVANLPAQPLGPGDLLNVVVYGVPNMSRPIRVSSEGDIRLPMISQPIKVKGLLPRDLEPIIADAFRTQEILVDPSVTVTVIEYQSLPITVSGAVKKPLTFQAYGKVTLLDAIARADGLSPEAGSEILVTRRAKDEPNTPAFSQRIPVKELLGGSSPDLNLTLTGGEEIRVPEAGKVFVLGNVRKPGEFRVEDPTDTSVLKVLALSEGVTPFASKVAYIYRREGSGSNKDEIPIELQKIMERKKPDVTLQANDILYIPDDKHRRLTMNMLDRIATFGAGTASGVLIWR